MLDDVSGAVSGVDGLCVGLAVVIASEDNTPFDGAFSDCKWSFSGVNGDWVGLSVGRAGSAVNGGCEGLAVGGVVNCNDGDWVGLAVGRADSGDRRCGVIDAALPLLASNIVLVIFTSNRSLLSGFPEVEFVNCFHSSCEYTLYPSAAPIMAELCQSKSYQEIVSPVSLAENG